MNADLARKLCFDPVSTEWFEIHPPTQDRKIKKKKKNSG
jgi:hypothetical protein